MSLSHSPQIVRDGLVLYLDAANIKSYPGSGTTWFDLSGNNNNATLVNSPTFSNNQFTFNGTTQYATMNSSTSLTTSTPTIFVGCTVASGTVLAKGGYGSYWNYGLTSITSTTFRARNDTGDATSNAFSTTSGYCIFGISWDQSPNIVFYRNGDFQSKGIGVYSPNNLNLLFLRIGCAWNANTSTNVEFYSGSISFIQIYNRYFSKSEFDENFNALRGRYSV